MASFRLNDFTEGAWKSNKIINWRVGGTTGSASDQKSGCGFEAY